MKKTIAIIAAAMAFMCININAFANQRCEEDWKERIMSEKIAFLTVEVGLTPEEAQTFWPVYNQVEQQKDAALEEVIKSYRALKTAVEQNTDTERLLEAYLAAQQNLRKIDNEAPEKYKSVLSADKVAKLYVAEEKFRRQHIRKLHGGHKEDKSN